MHITDPRLAAAVLLLAATTAFAAELTDGEVRKVDKAAASVTLRHGEIRHLDMPPMTMVFQVRDPALLDRLKPGDKLRFAVEKQDGKLVLTEVQPAK